MANSSTETWLPVVGYEGSYEVSDQGRVKSIARTVDKGSRGVQQVKERLLSQKNKRGYREVNLWINGKGRSEEVHRLVLQAFIGPRPDGCVCRHLNGTRSDNRLSNLQWGTPLENSADTKLHGMHVEGSRHPNAKLTEAQVATLRASSEPLAAWAERWGVSISLLSMARSGRRWRHVS